MSTSTAVANVRAGASILSLISAGTWKDRRQVSQAFWTRQVSAHIWWEGEIEVENQSHCTSRNSLERDQHTAQVRFKDIIKTSDVITSILVSHGLPCPEVAIIFACPTTSHSSHLSILLPLTPSMPFRPSSRYRCITFVYRLPVSAPPRRLLFIFELDSLPPGMAAHVPKMPGQPPGPGFIAASD